MRPERFRASRAMARIAGRPTRRYNSTPAQSESPPDDFSPDGPSMEHRLVKTQSARGPHPPRLNEPTNPKLCEARAGKRKICTKIDRSSERPRRLHRGLSVEARGIEPRSETRFTTGT